MALDKKHTAHDALLIHRKTPLCGRNKLADAFLAATPLQPPASDEGLPGTPFLVGMDSLVLMTKKEGSAAATLELSPDHPRITFGRGEDCDVRIQRVTVSTLHCEMVYDGRRWCLRHLSSTNDTVSPVSLWLPSLGCGLLGQWCARLQHTQEGPGGLA